MRAVDLVLTESKVGRDLQHLEDLIFIKGAAGIKKVLDYLTHVATSATHKDFSLKWDGMPAIYWGRLPDGTFSMVGKTGWGKADRGGLSTSPEELTQFIVTSGKGEEWRTRLAADLAACWHIFEAGTPEKFRGFFAGDLLYHPGNPFDVQDQKLVFTPNKVTYMVPIEQELGMYMYKSVAAAAAHKYYKNFGDETPDKMPKFNKFKTSDSLYFPSTSSQLVVLGPYFADEGAKIDTSTLKTAKAMFNSGVLNAIDEFLSPVKGLTNLAGDIYTFHNAQSKLGRLDDLADRFIPWAQENMGPIKFQALKEKAETNPQGLAATFKAVEAIRAVKNDIIVQLDQKSPQLQTHVSGQPGGEGWVYKDTKWVPRHIWKPVF